MEREQLQKQMLSQQSRLVKGINKKTKSFNIVVNQTVVQKHKIKIDARQTVEPKTDEKDQKNLRKEEDILQGFRNISELPSEENTTFMNTKRV